MNSIIEKFKSLDNKNKIIYISCIFLSIFNLLASTAINVNYWVHYPLNLLIAAMVILISSNKSKKFETFIDILFILLAVISIGYYMLNYSDMMWRSTFPTDLDTVFGIITIVICLVITRRGTGNGLFVVTSVFLLYGFLGQYLPGALGHAGFPMKRLIRMIYGEVGIFGSPLTATASFVFLFCLFGAFLQNFAGGQFFIDLATGAAGKKRGGPAKVAILASALFGTMSGSSIANVATTGTFTIPLMKKTGYKDYFAAAVEAVASTGGQIMPPVMGATAFLMAEITGIPYSSIAIAALIPSLLYFLSIFIMVDLEAGKLGLKGLDSDKVPDIKKLLKDKWPLLSPLIVIIILLLIVKASVSRTAIVGIIVTIIAPLIKRNIDFSGDKFTDSLCDGAKSCVNILAASSCAGIIIAILAVTGLGVKLGSFLIALSGGYVILLLFFTMIITLVLGMGLPTPSAYIVCVSVVGQTLVQAGIPLMAAHLFIFYFAILSTVTPPVALSSYTAAGIAQADPNKTGFTGVKLGLVAFIVPYMFVFGPALLMNGTAIEILMALATSIFGVFCLGFALQGFIKNKLKNITRILLFIISILLIETSIVTDIIGFILFILAVIIEKRSSLGRGIGGQA